MDIFIEQTHNPDIFKFIAPEFITDATFEYSTSAEAKESPLAQKLFQFPFVSKIIISANMVVVQKTPSISWEDIANDLKIIINEYYQNKEIIKTVDSSAKKQSYSLYAEMTPNPNAMKFVSNRILSQGLQEYKSAAEAQPNTLAAKVFELPFVKELLISDNYISIIKTEQLDWNDITIQLREFILDYLRSGQPILGIQKENTSNSNQTIIEKQSKGYSEIEIQIKAILDEYVKPAVANDGGNIELVEYIPESKKAIMLLQGSCSGCPSSTMTLKNGIENLLKDRMPDLVETVEALNG